MIAPYLDDVNRGRILEAAVATLMPIDDSALFDHLAGPLLPLLTPALREQVFARAAAINPWVLKRMLEYLPDHYLDLLVARIRASPGAYADDDLAGRVDGDRLAVLAEAAYAVPDDSDRPLALATIASHLPEADRPAAIAAAFDAFLGWERSRARYWWQLKALLPLLSEQQVGRLLSADLYYLSSIAPYATPDQVAAAFLAAIGPARLGESLAQVPLASAVESGYVYSIAGQLPGTVQYLPAEMRTAAARSALSLLGKLDERPWAHQVGYFAGYLTHDDLDEALRIADPQRWPLLYDAGIITSLAKHLTPAQFDRLLTATLAVENEGYRSDAIAEIAPFLDSARLVLVADAAAGIQDPTSRVLALAALQSHADADRRPGIADAVLTACAAIRDPENRAYYLTKVMPGLPADRRRAAWNRLFATVVALENSREAATYIPKLASLLP